MTALAIDLCCGLGGWTAPLLALGYYVVGFDIERHEYDGERYPGQLVLQDIRSLHGSQFREAALIVSSPPCQFFSYTAMPWTKAKERAARTRADPALLARELELFNTCFRIQREACEAAGRHVPMVLENVRGAESWVGRARWAFGSYLLWGDVPALMPSPSGRVAKRPGHETGEVSPDWRMDGEDSRKAPGFRFDGLGRSFQSECVERGQKTPGAPHVRDGAAHTRHLTNPAEHVSEGRKHHGDWFRDPDCPSRQGGQSKPAEGRKGAGAGAEWFDANLCQLPSRSSRRKAASARIAKIPAVLAEWIGRTYLPRSEAA